MPAAELPAEEPPTSRAEVVYRAGQASRRRRVRKADPATTDEPAADEPKARKVNRTPDTDRQVEVRGNLRAMTLAWHAEHPDEPATASALQKEFGAKWAGPIRLHQRAAVEAGLLVKVADKPETYQWKAGAVIPA